MQSCKNRSVQVTRVSKKNCKTGRHVVWVSGRACTLHSPKRRVEATSGHAQLIETSQGTEPTHPSCSFKNLGDTPPVFPNRLSTFTAEHACACMCSLRLLEERASARTGCFHASFVTESEHELGFVQGRSSKGMEDPSCGVTNWNFH